MPDCYAIAIRESRYMIIFVSTGTDPCSDMGK